MSKRYAPLEETNGGCKHASILTKATDQHESTRVIADAPKCLWCFGKSPKCRFVDVDQQLAGGSGSYSVCSDQRQYDESIPKKLPVLVATEWWSQ